MYWCKTDRREHKVKEENEMSEKQKKILEMLVEGRIGVDEAERLLRVLPEGSGSGEAPMVGTVASRRPKYLRVTVRPGPDHEHGEDAEHVNVRVPMSLIRSGIKLTSLMPEEARDKVNDALHEKGIDLNMRNMKPDDLEEIIEALSDLEVDVSSGTEVVKVFVE
jgi:hypothetical protein